MIGNSWYVGVFYNELKKLIEKFIEVEYIEIIEFSKKYGYDTNGYLNGFPTVFNPYNLIITNPKNNKTFVHSWHDFAPGVMEYGTGIEQFDVVKFSCVSNLNKNLYSKYSKKYKIQPSNYILEHLEDYELVEKNKFYLKKIEKLYFNGACYGIRNSIKTVLEKSNLFEIKDKHILENYKNKNDYYQEMSEYKYGFSMNGAAKICYRDLEYLGMGLLLFREKLPVMMHEQIIPNQHYFEILDDEIIDSIINYEDENNSYHLVENKIKYIIKNYDTESVIKNAREWYERNCILENQLQIFISYLENFKIFE